MKVNVIWGIVILLVAGIGVFFANLRTTGVWQLIDVTGHLPDLSLSLVDDTGTAVTEKNYYGEIVLLYFGFAGCSTQCPLTMEQVNRILKQVNASGKKTHFLFVTVNPANDSPLLLHQYISSFDLTHMSGLTGTDKEIKRLTKRYRASYQSAKNDQEITHSNSLYIFDTKGRARLLSMADNPDEKIIHDIDRIANEP